MCNLLFRVLIFSVPLPLFGIYLGQVCATGGCHDLLVRRQEVETCQAQYIKRRDGEYSFSFGPLHSTLPGEVLGWSCMKCGREFPSLDSAMEREWNNRVGEHAARYRAAARLQDNRKQQKSQRKQ